MIETSVLAAFHTVPEESLPVERLVCALSVAELTAGLHTEDAVLRRRRVAFLGRVETDFRVVPFDVSHANAYSEIWLAATEAGRKPRGRRAVDMLIAAAALAEGVPLYTRNGKDFEGLHDLLVARVV